MIVNYNGERLLPDCLEGLQAQTRTAGEVLLVDNGSNDDSVAIVQRRYPWVRIIESGENLGFAGGNNLGIRHSSGEYIVLLNNDTVPGPGFLENLVRPLDEDPSIAAVAGVLLFSATPDIVASAGIDVYANGLALDAEVGTDWRGLPVTATVFGPSGGAAAYRRSVLDDTGLFPPEFFLYLEDADLAWRMRLRGHKTVARRDAWALHVYSASANGASGLKDYYLARNRAWSMIRCWPAGLWKRYWWPVLKYEIGALGYAIWNRRWRSLSGRWRGWTGFIGLRDERRTVQARDASNMTDLLYWIRPAPSVRSLLGLRELIRKRTG